MEGEGDMLNYDNEEAPNISMAAGRIFKAIRDHGPLYGTDIVQWTGLAKSTVSDYLDRLMGAGLVRQELSGQGKRRKLKIAESAGHVIGVALGQSHVSVALSDLEAEIMDCESGDIDLVRETPEAILDRVIGYARELGRRAGLGPSVPFGIGLGLPSPVDYAHGVPVNPPVMPGWDHFPVASYLAQEFTCPVFVDNDVNLMALAERDKGVASDPVNRRGSFLLVKVGTGIGCGIVIDGRIYRGAKGAAGDIGHIGIDGDETLCRCGNRGCLEAVVGSRALVRTAESAARSGKSAYLAEILAQEAAIGPETLARGAASGDAECLRLLIAAGSHIGDVLAKLVNFFNPDLIIINGGLTKLGERFIASIRETVYRRSTPLATADLVVKRSALQEKAGTTGAAILVLDEIFSHRNVGLLMRRSS
jgi:predicted NBD/HSP70 family sugar kinase